MLPTAAVQEAAAHAETFAAASPAAATGRGYESDRRIFTAWCQAMDLKAAGDGRDESFALAIAKSKTDQERHGHAIAILRLPDSLYCPVQAVLDWMTMAGIEQGDPLPARR